MSTAIEVASLYGILSLKDTMSEGLDAAEKKAQGFGERISGVGDSVLKVGGSIDALTAPFIAGMGLAIGQAIEFDSSMTNVQAALGLSSEETQVMSDKVLALGANSRQGAQAAAAAMYDIAGGVADASTHMDILQTSLDVATAGSADLDGVVNAMVKTMNIYGLAAKDAAHAGDVFTRTVGMGVGTANEFAAALPPVEGLGKELGLTFDELGGMMAYMSTKSSSVAAGGTELKAVFGKLISPSAELNKAIHDMGYASGEALVKSEGLTGALKKIKDFGGGSFEGLITDQESLLGALALTSDGADEFFQTYKDGIDGATDKAKAIQMASPAAQLDLLKNSLIGLGIEIGNELMPALMDIVGAVQPIVGAIMDWVQANPDLVRQMGKVIGIAAALGAGLTALGLAIGVVGGAFTALTSPIGIAIGLGAALVAAYTTNFGGFADFVNGTIGPVISTLAEGFSNVGAVLERVSGIFGDGGVGGVIRGFFTVFEDGSSYIGAILEGFGMAEDQATSLGATLGNAFGSVSGFILDTLLPALSNLAAWFVSDGLPAIGNIISGVWNGIIRPFFDFLGAVWSIVGPALGDLAAWFVSDGFPGIVGSAQDVKSKIEEVFNWLAGVWETTIKPGIQPIVDWFTDGTAWNTITTAVNDVKTGAETVFNWLAGVWTNTLQPGVQPIVDWFTDGSAWNTITTAVNDVKTGAETVFNWLAGVWATVIQPGIQPIVDWFTNGGAWTTITTAINDLKTSAETVFNWLSTVWTTVIQPGIQPIVDWFTDGSAWQSLVTAFNDVERTGKGFFDWLGGIWASVQPLIQPIIDWFTSGTAWQMLITAVNDVERTGKGFFDWLGGIWATVQPLIQPVVDWFTGGGAWNTITTAIDDVRKGFDSFVSTVKGVWGSISGAVESIRSGIEGALKPVQGVIDGLKTAFENIVNAIGGTGGTVTVTPGAATANAGLGAPVDAFTHRAGGGPVWAGDPTVVGEDGQELFIPPSNGTIVSNQQLMSMFGRGGGNGGVSIGNVYVTANTEEGGRAAARGFSDELRDKMGARA